MTVVAIGYVRVSTSEQGASGLGLEAQRSAIAAACRVRGWELLEVFEDAGISSAAAARPGLDAALEVSAKRVNSVLVVAKLDRLARSVPDYGRLLERAKKDGWRLCALDAPDADTPQGEAMQAMTAVFAQLERRLIGQRTRDALAAAKARGVQLGRRVACPDDVAAWILEAHRGRRKLSARAIAAQLNADGIPAPRGVTWHPATVAGILTRAGCVLHRGRPRSPKRRGGAGQTSRTTSRGA